MTESSEEMTFIAYICFQGITNETLIKWSGENGQFPYQRITPTNKMNETMHKTQVLPLATNIS